jgi:hypothetical protein
VLLTAHHPRTLILGVVQVRRCSDRQELFLRTQTGVLAALVQGKPAHTRPGGGAGQRCALMWQQHKQFNPIPYTLLASFLRCMLEQQRAPAHGCDSSATAVDPESQRSQYGLCCLYKERGVLSSSSSGSCYVCRALLSHTGCTLRTQLCTGAAFMQCCHKQLVLPQLPQQIVLQHAAFVLLSDHPAHAQAYRVSLHLCTNIHASAASTR